MRKKIIAIFLAMAVLVSSGNVCALANTSEKNDESMSYEELEEFYNVKEMAEEYGVDENELLNNIYQGIHSNYFSPFSNLESSKQTESLNLSRGLSSATGQQSTMYLATGNPCASGKYPYIGCVAVHRKSKTDKSPILPFGTCIRYTSSSVKIAGKSYNNFIIEDTGDAAFTRTTYWTDVYGGDNTTANRKMAANYGVKTVSIEWD